MAAYSIVGSLVAADGFIEASCASTRLLRVAFYGEDTTVIASRVGGIIQSIIGNGAGTPEKFNTRSPSKSGFYRTFLSGSSIGSPDLIICGFLSFSHFSWTPSRHYFSGSTGTSGTTYDIGGGAVGTTQSLSMTLVISESQECSSGRNLRGRRSGKSGCLWSLGGCEITNHQKTGSGAFQIFVGHFDNEQTWPQPINWLNGSTQSDVWNINLYGATPKPRTFGTIQGA